MTNMIGRAFLRVFNGGNGTQRVMILAIVDVPEGTFDDGCDYAANVDGQVMDGRVSSMLLTRIADVTEQVPRGMNAAQILTSGIEAIWRR